MSDNGGEATFTQEAAAFIEAAKDKPEYVAAGKLGLSIAAQIIESWAAKRLYNRVARWLGLPRASYMQIVGAGGMVYYVGYKAGQGMAAGRRLADERREAVEGFNRAMRERSEKAVEDAL